MKKLAFRATFTALTILLLTSCGKTDDKKQHTNAAISTEEMSTEAEDVSSETEEVNTEIESTTATEEITEQQTVEKSLVQRAIEGRKFYFVSPQSGDVEEYVFKDNGIVEYNEYNDTDGSIHSIDTGYSFTYKVNDNDKSITLTRSNDNLSTTYYYIEEYNYFRTEVIPSDDSDPDGMPPQFWATGFFPYEYKGNSGDLYKYWYDVLSPTFYKDYVNTNTSIDNTTESQNSFSGMNVNGMYGAHFIVPDGFEDVSPSEVAMKYYYEFYSSKDL